MKKMRTAIAMALCFILIATTASAELFSEPAVTEAREFAQMQIHGKNSKGA